MANATSKEMPLMPMQKALATKPMAYIGGKPSPAFNMKGKRMKPSGDTPSTAAGSSVPFSKPLPIKGIK